MDERVTPRSRGLLNWLGLTASGEARQGRLMSAPNPIVTVGSVSFGNALPLALIAGPCALESRQHALEMASALKEIAGRERPYATADADAWGEDGDSFPSMHTAAAFAIGTVLAESGNDRVRWLRRTIGYGLAAGTAYARMDHDAHWLSDTVAGAALGLATARFVMKQRDDDRRGRLTFAPLPDGIEVGFVVDLRR